MRICILSAFFWPVLPLYYPYNMARALKESGHDVTVITVDSDVRGSPTMRPREDSFEGIKIIRCKNYLHITEFVNLWFPKISEEFDIIHCCGGYRHPYMFFGFLKKGKAKYVISTFYPMIERKNPILKLLVSIIDKTIGKSLLINSDCCFAETESEKKWLEEFGVKNIEIIPNPVPEEIFKKKQGSLKKKYKIKGKMIFCLANHTPIKNFEDLISASKDIDATIVIGGKESEYTKKCKELVSSIGVDNKIIWAGYMDFEQKLDAYASCDLFVLPSKRESLGTVLLEAMAQKKPVISTNKGGVPDVVPDNYCLYEPGDVKTLSEKIGRILTDKKFSEKLSNKGFRKAREYSYTNVSKRYVKIMESLIHKDF